MSTVAACRKETQAKQALAANVAAGKYPVTGLWVDCWCGGKYCTLGFLLTIATPHAPWGYPNFPRSQHGAPPLSLRHGRAIDMTGYQRDSDDNNHETESALRLAEGCTRTIKSLRAELADLTDKDEINV